MDGLSFFAPDEWRSGMMPSTPVSSRVSSVSGRDYGGGSVKVQARIVMPKD
jgi:hypothetical protein